MGDRPDDPVADAAAVLAGYLPILERLLAQPAVEGTTAPGMNGRPASAPEPWYTPAGHALMDALEGIRRLEAAIKYAVAGHPGTRRGQSAGNTFESLAALGKLAAGLTAEDADAAARIIYRWVNAAKSVHGIDERRRLRHLPRKPGDALPPRCPSCRCFQLVADLDARLVFCTVPGCQDRNGVPPVATLDTDSTGRPVLRWADGLVEVAPDLDEAS